MDLSRDEVREDTVEVKKGVPAEMRCVCRRRDPGVLRTVRSRSEEREGPDETT